MTTFSHSALQMLRSAESALAGESASPYKPRFADGGEALSAAPFSAASPSMESQAAVRLLSQQLQHVIQEVTQLKAGLAAERDGRSEAMTALGKRWREAVLVEVRSSDYRHQRDVNAVEERVAVQLKVDAAANTQLRNQVDALTRQLSARDASQFDDSERLRDELESLRAQVAEASAQSASVRVETARQAELERAALSRRLDAELLRYVEMRQDDQRELQKMKSLVREELQHVGTQVRAMVDEAWQTCAAALEKSVRESLVHLERDGKQNKIAVQEMQEAVANCTRTVQAELRVQTAAFKERIASLESNEAVMVSRVDRAEKKADAAHDTCSRLSAEVQGQRENLDRCTASAQRAHEMAQRIEAVQLDRDSRLQKVEQHLQATTTAEMLRAEVEGCKRAVGRLESRLDAVSAVTQRAEDAAERGARSAEAAVDRARLSEAAASKATQAAQEVVARVSACEQRVAAAEDVKEAAVAATERHDMATARLDQRLTTTENRLRMLGERHEQVTQDLMRTQEAHGARIETAHETASRSDAASALAKAEVNRLEKRLVKVESGVTTFTADCASIHAEVHDSAKELQTVVTQHRQLRERLEASEARFTEHAGGLAGLEATVTESVNKAVGRVEKQVSSLADHTQERLGQLEGQVRELVGKGDVERRITHRVNEWQTKVKDFVTEQYRSVKHRCEGIERVVQEHQTKLGTLEEVAAGEESRADEMRQLRDSVAELEAATQQRTAQCAQTITHTREALGTVQDELVRAQEDLGQTRDKLRRVERELETTRQHVDQLQHEMETTRVQQEEATRRALSASEAVAQRLALSLEKPLTAPSTSSTMMAANSADVSSPSAHIPSAQRQATASQGSAGAAPGAGSQPQMPPLSGHGSAGSRASSSSARSQEHADTAQDAVAAAKAHSAQKSRSELSAISSVRAPTDQPPLPSGSNSSERDGSTTGAGAAVSPAPPLAGAEVSGVNTSGQRTIIQRFNALDDSTTEEESVASRRARPQQRADEATDDVTTSTTTTPSRPVRASHASPLHPGADRDEDETSGAPDLLISSSQPTATTARTAGGGDGTTRFVGRGEEEEEEEEASDDSDLVLPMTGAPRTAGSGTHTTAAAAPSPSPARPSAAAGGRGGGGADTLHATPRKAFVHSSDDDDPLRHEEVPTHGKSTTTSSSSGERRSQSAEEVSRPAPAHAPSRVLGESAARPTGTRYTTFDDSDDDDEDNE